MEIRHQKEIENLIYSIRGLQVMFDSHLAEMYGVETKVLNQAVKRNLDRFPVSFRFQLTENEVNNDENLKSQFVTSRSGHGGRRTLPYAFTEQGVAMLSAVLRSETAVKVSIQIMNAFVQMRKLALNNASLFQRLDKIELKQLKTDEKLEQIFKAMEAGKPEPDKGIFFEGQIFDAYIFVAEFIKKAKTDIVLIDNYVDETVLTLLAKRPKNVNATIYTKTISKQLQLDLAKHNSQYPPITLKTFADSHDRFLIIDQKDLYHLGASLKDLGKKWFAFSKMDSLTADVLAKLKIVK
jgi:hypothetical protein